MRTVLYHANCYDGFCAAWVLWRWGGYAVAAFLPISYSDPVPWGIIDNHEVVVVDFSFKRAVMTEVIERAKKLVLLDHHKTAEQELAPFISGEPIPENTKIVFDMTACDSIWFVYA